MNKSIIIFLFLFLLSCSTQESEPPFTIQEKTASIALLRKMADGTWGPSEKTIILPKNVDEYYPLKRRNSPYMYNVSVKSPKNSHMKDKHTARLAILDEKGKVCGDKKKFTFYRIEEKDGMVEYRTYRDGEGQFLFLAEKEMPSHDWYQVLKVCNIDKIILNIKVLE
ncbi:MAG: hypothetical protein LBH25_15215 [Fibromonadaceae bacterium]|jgi:hypothetical protein|nr:hypothetical protein [Fibromonadaceae bacterium]